MTIRLISRPRAFAALARSAAWVADPAVRATTPWSTITTARSATQARTATSRRLSTTPTAPLRRPQQGRPTVTAGARRPRQLQPRRTYYSHDHPPHRNPFSETEQALLSAAYAHVPEHGFTHQALTLGARDAGYLDISPSILPDGSFSLIRWHLVTQRLALAEQREELFDTDNDPTDVDRKIAALARARLLSNELVIGKWQEVRNLL
jgi:hypothetical protein